MRQKRRKKSRSNFASARLRLEFAAHLTYVGGA
jgi:hypothetical protein